MESGLRLMKGSFARSLRRPVQTQAAYQSLPVIMSQMRSKTRPEPVPAHSGRNPKQCAIEHMTLRPANGMLCSGAVTIHPPANQCSN
jgi:hypothetical protein